MCSRDLQEGAVLHNIKTRFDRELIYVSSWQLKLHSELMAGLRVSSALPVEGPA